MANPLRTQLTIAAEFPKHFFLENLAVRRDNSLLITVANRGELYYLPPPPPDALVEPLLLHTFSTLPGGIAELEPDLFVILNGNVYTTHDNYLHRLDLRGWTPGRPAKVDLVLAFPPTMIAGNGCCALSPTTLLVADSGHLRTDRPA